MKAKCLSITTGIVLIIIITSIIFMIKWQSYELDNPSFTPCASDYYADYCPQLNIKRNNLFSPEGMPIPLAYRYKPEEAQSNYFRIFLGIGFLFFAMLGCMYCCPRKVRYMDLDEPVVLTSFRPTRV